MDNASQYNMPQSIHRLFRLKEYKPRQLAVAPGVRKSAEAELCAKGEEPEALIDDSNRKDLFMDMIRFFLTAGFKDGKVGLRFRAEEARAE